MTSGTPRPDQPDLHVVDPHAYADWEAVYRDNVVRVYGLLLRRVGSVPDAEDLTEDVMLRALRSLQLPAPVREVRSYLVKVIRSVLSEHSARHYGEPDEFESLDAHALEAVAALPALGSGERVRRLLAGLPERSRRVLELRFLERRSVREAARELGVSEANLKVIQLRALRQAAALARELRD